MPSRAQCDPEAAAAVRFMEEYTQYANAVMARKTSQSVEAWLRATPLVTARFRTAFRTLEQEGRRRDPDLGWGFDLILDAQDYPDKGFIPHSCGSAGFVELQGRDWPDFRLVVKVVRRDGVLLVDGAGRVNVPQAQRARR